MLVLAVERLRDTSNLVMSHLEPVVCLRKRWLTMSERDLNNRCELSPSPANTASLVETGIALLRRAPR